MLNRSAASAELAVAFIGQGNAVTGLSGIGLDDWLLFGLPESSLARTAAAIAAAGTGRPGLVFHLSGSEDASVLAPLEVPAASVHPLRPFHDPAEVIRSFAGTWCIGEGDRAALDGVLPAFEAIGGNILRAGDLDKRLYHAAGVMAGNYLVTLHDLALELAEAAGLERAGAGRMLESLQRRCLDAVAEKGAAGALTGPVERGDIEACRALVETMARQRPELDSVFRALGRETVRLAASSRPGGIDRSGLDSVFADPEEPTSS